MENWMIASMLGVFGLLLGSFAGATVWRLRARQLIDDEKHGEKVSQRELKKLKKIDHKSAKSDRSQCLSCGHQLAWYDLLPLVSWAVLGGKCRYCRKPIGWFEPLVELGTAIFFVVSFLAWPTALSQPAEIIQFGLWLVAAVGLIILFCYDAKWFLLPDVVMFPVITIAVVSALIHIGTAASPLDALMSVLSGTLVLSGLYYVLYIISKGTWIGFGDIKLGLALALLLADWRLSLLTLFLANIIGCLIVLPPLLFKKLGSHSRVPFGPMLIMGWVIASLWGNVIISWYLSSSFPVSLFFPAG